MDILNGTPQKVELQYDRQLYVFPAFEVVDVHPDAADFLIGKHKRTGIMRVRYGDNEDKVKLACMTAKLMWYRGAVARHERCNELQKEKKFPPLPIDPATRIAKAAIPEYEKIVAEMREKCGEIEGGEVVDEIQANLSRAKARPVDMPTLETQDLTVLRQMCKDRSIEFNMRWPRTSYVKAIKKHDKEAAEAAA